MALKLLRIARPLKASMWATASRLSNERDLSIYDAAVKYAAEKTPLVVIAGKLYGAGSSRDWAAKGPYLLGVKAVIAESFERIHRSNLVEMGILPLEFTGVENAEKFGLTGLETFTISGISDLTPGRTMEVTASAGGKTVRFTVKCRVDSAIEVEYYRAGGILPFVLKHAMTQTS